MSRIRVEIDRLVLNGFEPLEGKAVSEALEGQLQQVLADPGARNEGARSHRTPVMRLGRMPLEPGTTGATQLGEKIARAIGTGVKP
jgi:hypothetical protein